MIRILVVEDQDLLRQKIQALLEPKLDLAIVGAAQSDDQVLEKVKNLRPDLVLIDIDMPKMDGLTTTHQISQKFPYTTVLALSSQENRKYATKVLQAGAKGYLFKSNLLEDLEKAICLVYKDSSQTKPKLPEKPTAKSLIDNSNSPKREAPTLVKKDQMEQNLPFGLEKATVLEKKYQSNSQKISQTNISNTSQIETVSQSQLVHTKKSEIATKKKRRLKRLGLIPIAALLLGVGVYTRNWFFSSTQTVPGTLRVSGRIEGSETNIGAKIGGLVKSVALEEGDQVKKGQLIAEIDDAELQAQLQGASARLNVARQQQKQARLQINFLESQIQEAKLNLQQNIEDTKGRVFEAEASLSSSTSQLNEAIAGLQQAKFEFELAKTNRDRFAKLLAQGAISQQRFDEIQTTFKTAQTRVEANQASVNSFKQLTDTAKGQLIQAQTTQLNPDISNARIRGLRTQIERARSEISAAQAEVDNARAAKKEIQSRAADLNIVSPIDGVVTTRTVEPGEVIATGQPILAIINPKTVYLRGYIPQGKIGGIKVGQKAKLFLDSAPDRALSAKITAIDSQASFTPENVYFFEDRVKQVFGVKISIDNPNGYAKPGLPADAEIITTSKLSKLNK